MTRRRRRYDDDVDCATDDIDTVEWDRKHEWLILL